MKARTRKALPKSAFVYPKTRSYPIHTRAHARSALRLSAKKSTRGSYSTVRRAVARRYPGLVKKRK